MNESSFVNIWIFFHPNALSQFWFNWPVCFLNVMNVFSQCRYILALSKGLVLYLLFTPDTFSGVFSKKFYGIVNLKTHSYKIGEDTETEETLWHGDTVGDHILSWMYWGLYPPGLPVCLLALCTYRRLLSWRGHIHSYPVRAGGRWLWRRGWGSLAALHP